MEDSMTTTSRPPEPARPYWAVVAGAYAFPVLPNAERGVRVDLALDADWAGGRVYTTEDAAEHAWRSGRLVNSSLRAAGRPALSDAHYSATYRVQRVMRLEGLSLPTVWLPADDEQAAL